MFKVGDIVIFKGDENYHAARHGATAQIVSLKDLQVQDWINVKWVSGPINGQNNGNYSVSDFELDPVSRTPLFEAMREE